MLLLACCYVISNYNYLLFHSTVELFSIAIAFTIGVIAINCWQSIRNQYVLFVGIAYVFVGLIDVLHTLSYKGMQIFLDYDYYAPQLWIAARYMEAISMLLGFCFLGTRFRVNLPLMAGAYLAVTGTLVASIFYFRNFPICFVAGRGLTPFKVNSEYLICVLMLVNLGLLYWYRHFLDVRVYRLLACAAVSMIGMELCFTLYVADTMADFFNKIGHLLKVITYYLIYKAVVVTALRDPINLLFRELKEKEEELEKRVIERTGELAESRARLAQAMEQAHLVYWEMDAATRTFTFNDRFYELFATSAEREGGYQMAVENYSREFLLPEERTLVAEEAERLMSGEVDEYRLQHQVRRRDGKLRHLLVRASVVTDDSGRISGARGSSQDITELKQVELALTKSQERFALVEQAVDEALWERDLVADEIYCSPRWKDLLAYEPDECPKRVADFVNLVHPDDREHLALAVRNHLEAGKAYSIEYRMRHKDGAYRWILSRGKAVFDKSGRPVRMIGAITDRTEFRKIEDALRDSEARFRSMADTAPVLIWIAGTDSLCFWFNKVWLDYTGRTAEQEAGDGWAQGVHPEDLQRCLETYTRNFAQRTAFHMEYRLRRHDGEYRWLYDHGVPRFSADGEFEGYIGSCVDIHDRKKINEERDLLLRIIEEAPDFISTSDMQANVKFINTAGARLVGLPEGADLSRLEIKDMHPSWGAKLVLEEGIPAVLEEGFWQHENALLNKSTGVEIPVSQLLLLHRDGAGNPVRLSTIMRDITDIKNTQDALTNAKHSAEAASIAKSRFLATMSHEIRTPMNGIFGMAQLLLAANVKDEDRQNYARIILNSGHNLLTLLNDILDLSKVEAGRIELESVAFDAGQLVREVEFLFAEAAGRKGLMLEFTWAGPSGQRYLGDPNRLRQMITNLISNAIKFTEHGCIRLVARELDRQSGSAVLDFSVADTGIGVSPAQQKLLFQPFTQADSSTTRNYGGTGLGLSIVRAMANLMGGEVGVTGKEGEGSCFWFRVPARLAAPAADGPHPQGAIREKASLSVAPGQLAGRVLIVESDPTNRKVIEAQLKFLGLTVVMAEDGAKAVELISGGDMADLILMETRMQQMDGYQATRRIRQWEFDNGREHRPIVALTGDAFEESRRKCLAAGMNDVVIKPIASISVLKAVLGRWLPGEPKTGSLSPVTEKPVDVARVVEIMNRLDCLLRQKKFASIDCFVQLQEVVDGTIAGKPIAEAKWMVDSFLFDQVRKRLREIAAVQGWELNADN